ncbi:hypothetical protein [Lysinibacillus telephonicus]|uniref:Uncharacterized protein n=1 Tax=Lysinibacillus telephonicus TaxID=1714840 RepID=A0A431UQ41_9BACI|nr:hypothetical protein [Lysinibacillus telephonicus]RTQ92244.1 hypothetical protein EKG35_12210 [Lysinibacillus telephonicus]
MNKVSLSNKQLQSFINMTEERILKKGKQTVIDKLTSMGMQNIEIEGRGKKAVYTFEIPDGFYKLLMIPKSNLPRYSEIAIECIEILIQGNIRNGIVMFQTELIGELASKYGTHIDGVSTTFNRIKGYLDECGLLTIGEEKSNRVKIGNNWVVEKPKFDEHAKELRKECELLTQLIPQVSSVAFWRNKAEVNITPPVAINHQLDGKYYYVSKSVIAKPQLLDDIHFAQTELLKTFDLNHVRNEILKRHEQYKQEINQGIQQQMTL